MIEYLPPDQIEMSLRARRVIEQWLGVRDQQGRRVIKWLAIEPDRGGGYRVRLREAYDDGNPDFVDIHEFEALDLDQPEGILTTFPDWKSALSYAGTLGASNDRFVPSGKTQDVYQAFVLGLNN